MKTLWLWSDGIVALAFAASSGLHLWAHEGTEAWLTGLLFLFAVRCQLHQIKDWLAQP